MSLARYVRRVPPISRGAPRHASSWNAHHERARRAFFAHNHSVYERLRADPEAWNEMLRENAAWDPMLVPADFLNEPAPHPERLLTSRPQGTSGYRRMGLTRLTWQRSDRRADRAFEDAMRRAYERLKADPVAWREYMEEAASINPGFVDAADSE